MSVKRVFADINRCKEKERKRRILNILNGDAEIQDISHSGNGLFIFFSSVAYSGDGVVYIDGDYWSISKSE